MSFLGNVAKTAVGVAPYLSRAVQETEDRGLNTSLKKAQVASLTNKGEIIGHQIAQDGTPYNIHRDGTWVKASVEDGSAAPPAASAPAPSAPAPESPSFAPPTQQDWTDSLRRAPQAPQQQTPPQQATPPVAVTPQQGTPVQATPAPPGVRTAPKFGKPVGPVKLDPNDPTVAANKVTAVGNAQKPFLSDAATRAVTTDSTKKANAVTIANSPTAIAGDSLRKVNGAQAGVTAHAANRSFDVANPLPTKAGAGAAGKIDPNSPAGITADSTKKANAAAIKAGTGNAGGANADKERIYVNLMDQSYPTMERLIDKVRPAAIAAAIHYPTAANAGLNQDEQTFLAASRDFLAGMLHAESGARLSKEQLNFGLQRILPNLGDENPTLHAKLNSAKQTLVSRKALFAAPAGGGRGATPGNPARGNDPGGNVTLGGASPLRQKYDAAVAHLKSQGLKDADIVAKIGGPPGGE